MFLLVKEWKLVLAGTFLLSSLCLAGYIKWQNVKIDRAGITAAQREATIADLTRAVADRDAAFDSLRRVAAEQGTKIEELRREGGLLADRLRATESRLSRERAAWAVREAELSKPLPSDCEAKVRESVRRVQAALAGVSP